MAVLFVTRVAPGFLLVWKPGNSGSANELDWTRMANYDAVWKEALEAFFREFLQLLFPVAHAEINWRHRPTFMDKELQQVKLESDKGLRIVEEFSNHFTREDPIHPSRIMLFDEDHPSVPEVLEEVSVEHGKRFS